VSRRSAPRRAPSISSPSEKEADRCLVVGHDGQLEPVGARGQMLDRDQEREFDRFAGDDRLVRPVACIGDLVEQTVGVRREPADLARRWGARFGTSRYPNRRPVGGTAFRPLGRTTPDWRCAAGPVGARSVGNGVLISALLKR
jgi:hypothetical protein